VQLDLLSDPAFSKEGLRKPVGSTNVHVKRKQSLKKKRWGAVRIQPYRDKRIREDDLMHLHVFSNLADNETAQRSVLSQEPISTENSAAAFTVQARKSTG
jgi:hypothetical protein